SGSTSKRKAVPELAVVWASAVAPTRSRLPEAASDWAKSPPPTFGLRNVASSLPNVALDGSRSNRYAAPALGVPLTVSCGAATAARVPTAVIAAPNRLAKLLPVGVAVEAGFGLETVSSTLAVPGSKRYAAPAL